MVEIQELGRVLDLSEMLEEDLFNILLPEMFSNDEKTSAMHALFNISVEHAKSLRGLTKLELPTSAVAMLRLQYEAVVKLVWVLYVASESEIRKLIVPLTLESEQIASNSLPAFSDMFRGLEKKAPPPLYRQLNEFKSYSWKSLNSYVHSGIHAVTRKREGFPIALLLVAIRQSNNLTSISTMALTCLINDNRLSNKVAEVSKGYAECLLLAPTLA